MFLFKCTVKITLRIVHNSFLSQNLKRGEKSFIQEIPLVDYSMTFYGGPFCILLKDLNIYPIQGFKENIKLRHFEPYVKEYLC